MSGGKTVTNGDRIRSMSDEELFDWIDKQYNEEGREDWEPLGCYDCIYDGMRDVTACNECDKCEFKDGILAWLKQEEVEYGTCDVCGKKGNLVRTYFYYPIKCACCSPRHFELIHHHKECKPTEPEHVEVEFKAEDLKAPASFASKVIEEAEVISDGYHTFDELYFHRMMLFSVICNTYKDKAWKSKLHDDGTMYGNYFIVGITTPEGDYTYPYHMEYWGHFEDIKELPRAPKWDGHITSISVSVSVSDE